MLKLLIVKRLTFIKACLSEKKIICISGSSYTFARRLANERNGSRVSPLNEKLIKNIITF